MMTMLHTTIGVMHSCIMQNPILFLMNSIGSTEYMLCIKQQASVLSKICKKCIFKNYFPLHTPLYPTTKSTKNQSP